MSQKEDLRYAAKGTYEGNSTRISDCFVLEGLKNIDVIYVPADAPAWVKEIAVQLKQMVKKQYPDTDTEIVLIKPLFNRFSYPDNYLLWNVYHSLGELCLKNEENEKLLLCGTNEAAAMMRLHSTAVKKYGLKHLPSLFLDVDAYRRCSSYPWQMPLKGQIRPVWMQQPLPLISVKVYSGRVFCRLCFWF